MSYESGGQLTNRMKARPFSLILFDEIEKAHPRIMDKFLQVLDDGRLTDGMGETVYFSQSFIIFTSNIGSTRMDRDPAGREKVVPVLRPDMTYQDLATHEQRFSAADLR
jgi:ATP-dependent Clp protease ATP-binding subunit ClpA